MPPHANGSVVVQDIALCSTADVEVLRVEASVRRWLVRFRYGGESNLIVWRVPVCLEILLYGIKPTESLSIHFRDAFMLGMNSYL